MKRAMIVLAILCVSVKGFSQTDSTTQKKDSTSHHHHSHWETMMDKHMKMMDSTAWSERYPWPMPPHHWDNHAKPSNLSTNWLIVDLGFTNYTDKTNYSSATAQAYAPGGNSNWFNLKNNKSVDVNIWLFMQRLNMINHVVNLKYGLGIELNNYRYQDNIVFLTNPSTQATYVIQDTISFSKNKMAVNYVTVPLMLNFNFTPSLREGFGISVGISAGYLYNSHQKVDQQPVRETKNPG